MTTLRILQNADDGDPAAIFNILLFMAKEISLNCVGIFFRPAQISWCSQSKESGSVYLHSMKKTCTILPFFILTCLKGFFKVNFPFH